VNYSDYPGIQQAADKASLKAQKYYTSFMKANLCISLIAAFLAIYNFHSPAPKTAVYIVSAILLFLTIILTLIIKQTKFEDYWYQGRALAESVKTLTWRFVTCSEGFESSLDQHMVRTKFTSLLSDMERQFNELSNMLDTTLAAAAPITQTMENIRGRSWQDRLKYYITNRIIEQKNWYTSRAAYNYKMKNVWFWVAIVAQVFALTCSIILIVDTNTDWNFVGVFTTLSATAFAWLELKQHQALKQAYTTTAIELGQVESLGVNITTEIEFTRYVLDSENAISREHTVWLAQRRK